MRSLIILRQSEAWDELNNDTYLINYRRKFRYAYKHKPNQYQTYLDRVHKWDYIIPFFQYRANLCEVAKNTWKNTGINVVNVKDYDFNNNNNDLILIPTDDDDWFCPDLHNILETAFVDPNVTVVIWQSHHWHPNKMLIDHPKCLAASNGYAVRANVATKHLINYHLEAHKQEKFHRIPQLGNSIWVRHKACWTKMSEQTVEYEALTIPRINDPIKWAEEHIYKLLILNMEIPLML